MRNNKSLKDKCDALAEMVISIAPIYRANLDNKNKTRLIETTIGASIWYLPHGTEYWTGYISSEAISQYLTIANPKLTKDHQFPRKIAAREILLYNWDEIEEPGETLLTLYKTQYGKYNYVTPRENKNLIKFQKEDVFKTVEKSYQEAGITLIKVSDDELQRIKKKDERLINRLMDRLNILC